MIIDAHHHLWDLDRGYPWLDDPALGKIRRTFTVEDLRAELSANGIDHTVLVEAGLAFDLVIRSDQLPSAATVATDIPELTFVLDHLGKPSIRDGRLAEWRSMLAPLADQPNVYAKLSGLVTEADWESWTPTDLVPVIDAALELFGAQRLMFGSDWPVCLLAASYRDVKGALDEAIGQLSQSEKDDIYAGTAIRAYGLGRLLST